MKPRLYWAFCLVASISAVPNVSASADEGGGSNYLQGTDGAFQMAIFGPPGLYFREDLFR